MVPRKSQIAVTFLVLVFISAAVILVSVDKVRSLAHISTEEAKTESEGIQKMTSKLTRTTGTDTSKWWHAAALLYWTFVSPVDYQCTIAPMGNKRICQSPPFTVKKPCLVYSFGIANDFSFDGKVGTRLGCEVHSFDPSMLREDFQYSKEVTFHNMGIGAADTDDFHPGRDSYVKEKQVWKMRTLKSIMKELGHENRVLDILKMDIEGHEWDVMRNILENGLAPKIRQFSLEWHIFPKRPARNTYFQLYELFETMKQNGFRQTWHKMESQNLHSGSFNLQCDMTLVNTKFKH